MYGHFWTACLTAAFLFFGPMVSCSGPVAVSGSNLEYASFLKLEEGRVISFSPYSWQSDTLCVSRPLGRVVCMSTSHVAFLDALDCDSVICAVSGTGFISSAPLQERIARGEVKDVGYDQAPDYETIVSLNPDVVLAYNVSAVPSPFASRLKSLGIRVFPLYEFLENHPLARTEYVKAFGLMTGRQAAADSVFGAVRAAYDSLAGTVSRDAVRAKVLINIPYGDLWYIPGADSYMARLVSDAGGEILGAQEGTSVSGVISLEEAFVLSGSADFWFNTGLCRTRAELNAVNPAFSSFGVKRVYNNVRRCTAGGGNDFWESGCLRPDLILQDLITIFKSSSSDSTILTPHLHYYIEVQ